MAASNPSDPSPNRLRLGDRDTGHIAPVIRELGELMTLERALSSPTLGPIEEYHLLSVIVARELPYARNIPRKGEAPSTANDRGDRVYRQWRRDRATAEQIFDEFLKYPVPALPELRYEKIDGTDGAEFKVIMPGHRSVATITEASVAMLPNMLEPNQRRACQLAIPPLRKSHIQIRTILDRWGIWTAKTEAALFLSSHQRADSAKFFPSSGDSEKLPVELDEDDGDDDYGDDEDENDPFERVLADR